MLYDDISLSYLFESTTEDGPVTLGALIAAVRAMAEMDEETLLDTVSAGDLDQVFPYRIGLPEKAPTLERWDDVVQQGDASQSERGISRAAEVITKTKKVLFESNS